MGLDGAAECLVLLLLLRMRRSSYTHVGARNTLVVGLQLVEHNLLPVAEVPIPMAVDSLSLR